MQALASENAGFEAPRAELAHCAHAEPSPARFESSALSDEPQSSGALPPGPPTPLRHRLSGALARPRTASRSTRPTTRATQSPFSVILGRAVHVPQRPRSVLRDCSPRKRLELEAPRQHMGRKTQAKAMRNRRYAAALQALERSQQEQRREGEAVAGSSADHDLEVSGAHRSEPAAAATCSDSASEGRGGENAVHDSAVHAYKAPCSGTCTPQRSALASMDAGFNMQAMDIDGALAGEQDGKPGQRIGIVDNVLANLRRD
jgi:hypothetical protein